MIVFKNQYKINMKEIIFIFLIGMLQLADLSWAQFRHKNFASHQIVRQNSLVNIATEHNRIQDIKDNDNNNNNDSNYTVNNAFKSKYNNRNRHKEPSKKGADWGKYRDPSKGNGKYSPRGNDGRWIPDNRGAYHHIVIPYNGGYGDRGARGGYYDGDFLRYKHAVGPQGPGNKYHHINGPNGGYGRNNDYQRGSANGKPPDSGKNRLVASPSPLTANSSTTLRTTATATTRRPIMATRLHTTTYKPRGTLPTGNRIIRWEKFQKDKNEYAYAYETENKIVGEEIGQMKPSKHSKEQGMKMTGFYEYVGDDGETYRVEYEAGEGGFVPKGTHIHKAIQRAAQYLSRM